jgi:hypothetical protein
MPVPPVTLFRIAINNATGHFYQSIELLKLLGCKPV